MQFELTFGNDSVHLTSVRAFFEATFQQLPLDAAVAQKLELFIGASIEDAIAHAYPAGENGLIKLSIHEQHGKLEIRIRDFGIPKDINLLERQLQKRDATAPQGGGILDANVADEIHWLTFGPKGKALQIVKWLHDTHIADGNNSVTLSPHSRDTSPAPAQQYTIRRMRAGEAEQVSQLIYRTYGGSYFNADVYYPDRLAAQNERGVVLSYVAVGEDGKVASHYALELNRSGPVAEGGQAVVDPAHRGRGLLNQMKDLALKDARELGLLGWYADAVTVHTLTQKSNTAYGAQLTAVDLAIAPSKEQFDTTNEQPQRVTCLLYFHWLQSPTPRTVHVPARHQAIVGEIYKRLDCPITFGDSQRPTGHASHSVQIEAGAARANVSINVIGESTVQLIRNSRRDLVERTHVEAVFVDLPVADPATVIVAEELEKDGFGFLGIAPHFSPDGDVLRLAYLVKPLAREPIHTLDEIAGQMVDYTLAEQERLRAKL